MLKLFTKTFTSFPSYQQRVIPSIAASYSTTITTAARAPQYFPTPSQTQTKTILSRRTAVPAPHDQTPLSFLTKIGRDSASHAALFASWPDLFNTSPEKMRKDGMKPAAVKYLCACREWYRKRGGFPEGKMGAIGVEVPVRRKKWLIKKNMVKRTRLEKLGLA